MHEDIQSAAATTKSCKFNPFNRKKMSQMFHIIFDSPVPLPPYEV